MIRGISGFVAVLLGSGLTWQSVHGVGAGHRLAQLASDFDRRFIAVCTSQGLARARCDCLLGVFKEHIADDNLELIIGYFEDPAGFQDRIAELDLDPERAEALREEIDEAVAASREECGTGP